jgi:hypothetical protein
MQYVVYGVPRIHPIGTWVNKGIKKGRSNLLEEIFSEVRIQHPAYLDGLGGF